MSSFVVRCLNSIIHVSRLMTKPTKWLCAQRRLWSDWASAQSDQSLRCPHEESLGPYLPIEHIAKTQIRLGRCPGWSESSLGAQSFCWFCHVVAHVSLIAISEISWLASFCSWARTFLVLLVTNPQWQVFSWSGSYRTQQFLIIKVCIW